MPIICVGTYGWVTGIVENYSGDERLRTEKQEI